MFALKRIVTSVARRNGKEFSKIQEKHTLPALPYEYNALEPIICGDLMQVHHQKHHLAYVNGLNDVQEKVKQAMEKSDLLTVISLSNNLKFNYGGHLNHSLYWEGMSPNGGQPSCELSNAIQRDFECVDKLIEQLNQIAVGVQGSGWAWLGYNRAAGRLELAKCANQDPLESTTGLVPLLCIDVWEHAYYLQYRNLRADYVKNFWSIVNWCKVSERFANACQNK